MHEESDIDVAVFFDPSLPARDYIKALTALIEDTAVALGVPAEAIDAAVLNKAPVFLKHIVITEGKVIYERDHSARVDFELSTMQQYDDERHYEELAIDTIEAALAKLAGAERVVEVEGRWHAVHRVSKEDAMKKLFGDG
jgi:hypothetical protein